MNKTDSFGDCPTIIRGFVLSILKFNSLIKGPCLVFATHPMLINSMSGSKSTQQRGTAANWAIEQLFGVAHLYSYFIPRELKFNVSTN